MISVNMMIEIIQVMPGNIEVCYGGSLNRVKITSFASGPNLVSMVSTGGMYTFEKFIFPLRQ